MIEAELSGLIRAAVDASAPELGHAPYIVEVTRTRQKEHGDYATNIALALGAASGRNPREVAEILVRNLPQNDVVAKVEVAGPGFINFFVAHGWLYRVLEEIDRQGPAYGRLEAPEPEHVQVEFVSANPTGPLHVGQGRNAALGDGLARVLEAAGHRVQREYYVNDTGTQAALFGASVEARYLEHVGREGELPKEGYHGEYVKELAAQIAADLGDSLVEASPEERRARLAEEGMRRVLDGIRATVERFRIRFDDWVHESTLHAEGRVQETVQVLQDRDLAYEKDGAVWFRSTRFGDDKDRVLIRATGDPTYFAADCAYLRHKFDRGFDRLIYVWGADHHGTVPRLRGAAEALGYEVDRVEALLVQLVSLYRAGEPARMSKRTGDIVSLDELLDEVGTDAARYTLLSRSGDTALDFDIELVKRQSLDNPVYYVQYAHARIASLIRFAEDQGTSLVPLSEIAPEELVHETELDLLRKLADLPEQIRLAANLRAPYRLTRYAEELAADFHRFYTECRVVTDDPALTQARLHLSAATMRVIGNVLDLLGVTAPESMERLEQRE
ncbi:MAG TPA: arginine--tRNA ligase [Actinomycetota bacterium]|nr:arginine--tRNA ligase [Actinomycetota bacterium]